MVRHLLVECASLPNIILVLQVLHVLLLLLLLQLRTNFLLILVDVVRGGILKVGVFILVVLHAHVGVSFVLSLSLIVSLH